MTGIVNSIGARSGIIGTVASGTIDTGVVFTGFVGTIASFGMATIPTGWLLCDGAAISRTVTYSALFAAVGTTWGVGDGSATFNIPDLEGAFLRGAGTSTQFTQDRTITLAAAVNDSVQSHEHALQHGTAWDGFMRENNSSGPSYYNYPGDGYGGNDFRAKAITVGRGDNETRPNSIGVRFYIKF